MKRVNICLSVLVSLVFVLATGAFAQDMKAAVVTPDEITWTEGPASLPGVKMAVIEGDPNKPEIFTMRLKVPAGTKFAAHVHNNIERVTVISGTFNLAMGEKPENPRVLPAGSYFSLPVKTVHNGWVDEDTILQITTMGPWTFEPVKKQM